IGDARDRGAGLRHLGRNRLADFGHLLRVDGAPVVPLRDLPRAVRAGGMARLADHGQHVLAGDAATRAAACDPLQVDADFTGETADRGAGSNLSAIGCWFWKRGGWS